MFDRALNTPLNENSTGNKFKEAVYNFLIVFLS